MIKWLAVYFLMEAMHLIERFVAGLFWLYAKDPAMAECRLYLFFRIWVYFIEASWIIYGSTFVYGEEIDECES